MFRTCSKSRQLILTWNVGALMKLTQTKKILAVDCCRRMDHEKESAHDKVNGMFRLRALCRLNEIKRKTKVGRERG